MTSDPNEIPHGDQLMKAQLEIMAAFRRPYATSEAEGFQLLHTFGAALTDHYAALAASSAENAHCEDDQDKILALSDALHEQATNLTLLAMKARDIAEGRTPPTTEG